MTRVHKASQFLRPMTLMGLGLNFFFASADLSLAAPKRFRPGATYCQCGCKTSSGTYGLTWGKVASCNVVGKKCAARNSAGVSEPGKLVGCTQCTASQDGEGFSSCQDVGLASFESGGVDPGPRTPSEAPFSKPAMKAPIFQSGLEGGQHDSGMANPSGTGGESK